MSTLDWTCTVCGFRASGLFEDTLAVASTHRCRPAPESPKNREAPPQKEQDL